MNDSFKLRDNKPITCNWAKMEKSVITFTSCTAQADIHLHYGECIFALHHVRLLTSSVLLTAIETLKCEPRSTAPYVIDVPYNKNYSVEQLTEFIQTVFYYQNPTHTLITREAFLQSPLILYFALYWNVEWVIAQCCEFLQQDLVQLLSQCDEINAIPHSQQQGPIHPLTEFQTRWFDWLQRIETYPGLGIQILQVFCQKYNPTAFCVWHHLLYLFKRWNHLKSQQMICEIYISPYTVNTLQNCSSRQHDPHVAQVLTWIASEELQPCDLPQVYALLLCRDRYKLYMITAQLAVLNLIRYWQPPQTVLDEYQQVLLQFHQELKDQHLAYQQRNKERGEIRRKNLKHQSSIMQQCCCIQ